MVLKWVAMMVGKMVLAGVVVEMAVTMVGWMDRQLLSERAW